MRPDTSIGVYAVRASDVRRRPVKWLWPGRIPAEQIAFLIGDPGLGKSMLGCQLAAKLSRGELVGGPAATLFISAEDSIESTLRPRLEAAGADLELVYFPQIDRDDVPDSFTLPDDVGELDRLVHDHEARLLIVDPLTAHLPDSVNSWRDQSVRRALAPLYRLADERRCAVLLIAHLNKALSADPLRRMGGSIGMPAAARSVMLLARDPDDGDAGTRRVLAHVKCNVGPLAPSLLFELEPVLLPGGIEPDIETARLVERGETHHLGHDLLAVTDSEARTAKEDAEAFLRGELEDGPRPVKELRRAARQHGIADRTLDRAKASLRIVSEKSTFDGGWTWTLPSTDGQHADEERQEGWRPSENGAVGVLGANAHNERDSDASDRLSDAEERHPTYMASLDGIDVDAEAERIRAILGEK